MVVFAALSGLATGMAPILFFPGASYESQILLTMLIVCWSAAGVATAAAYAPAFYAFVGLALAPLATCWLVIGASAYLAGELNIWRFQDLALLLHHALLALLIMYSGVLQAFFARDSEALMRESFGIRFQNEALIRELRQERQEAATARDRAEQARGEADTARERAEEANQAKSRFLASASHDLRQPLHALSLFAAALNMRMRDPEARTIFDRMSVAMTSLGTLLDALLDISKLDAGAVKPLPQQVDLRALIERLEAEFQPLALNRGIRFATHAASVTLETDPVLLERVIRNLVDNAIKYTERGNVMVASTVSGGEVLITIRDTGSGIPAEERGRIFEEFYQIDNAERDRSRGLGLGLAIVRRIAALLEAAVEVESREGYGSTFSVRLPYSGNEVHTEPRQVVTATHGEGSTLHALQILVIDDETEICEGMRVLLESWGWRVKTIGGLSDIAPALESCTERFDAIVADFRLRDRENGIETVRAIRQRIGEIPAVLVSGDTSPERLREAEESGIPLLHKPVPPAKLRQALEQLVAGD